MTQNKQDDPLRLETLLKELPRYRLINGAGGQPELCSEDVDHPYAGQIVYRADELEAALTAVPFSSTLTVVVNGQPVEVTSGPVPSVIQQAITKSGQIGAPIAQWELRTREGDVIPHDLDADFELTAGRLLFLNLGLPKLEAQAVPSSPETPLCKESEHRFGNCKTCGMPWLASRLELPTKADIAWAARVIHNHDKHPGAFELCSYPSCAGQVLDEALREAQALEDPTGEKND
jgi:hypothetical protein